MSFLLIIITDQDKCPTKRAIVEHVAKLKRSMGIGGVRGKVKVKGDEVQEEEEDDGLGNFGKSGKKEKKKKMKGTVNSSDDPTRLRGKGRQGKSQMSSRSTRDMTDDELVDEPILEESPIKNEDAEYASLPFTAMMAEDDTPCPTPRSTRGWGSIPWMFDEEEDEAEAETERDDSCEAVRIPGSVEEIPSKILRPSTLPPLSSSSSTKEDDTPTSTKRSKTSHQEKSSPGVITSTATFPKNISSSSSSSTPTTYSNMLSPPNPSSSATTTFQEKEELDKQQDPDANSYSNDLFVSPFWETAQAESTATSSSVKMKKKNKMEEKEKKRSYHIVDVDAAYCSRGNKKRLKRSNDDDDDDDVGGGSSSSRMGGGRGTRKKRIPLAVLEDYPVGQ